MICHGSNRDEEQEEEEEEEDEEEMDDQSPDGDDDCKNSLKNVGGERVVHSLTMTSGEVSPCRTFDIYNGCIIMHIIMV
jgi:hypothetical protein